MQFYLYSGKKKNIQEKKNILVTWTQKSIESPIRINVRVVSNIGVARILDWGRGKPQIGCKDVIRNFRKRNFCGTKISQNGRSEAVAWFGNSPGFC